MARPSTARLVVLNRVFEHTDDFLRIRDQVLNFLLLALAVGLNSLLVHRDLILNLRNVRFDLGSEVVFLSFIIWCLLLLMETVLHIVKIRKDLVQVLVLLFVFFREFWSFGFLGHFEVSVHFEEVLQLH